ncbi:TRAP transporter small permease subunit [Nitrogeniibacter mangrovi]|uniref:TRAP transporter small permease protein n=1 Tax=Nitrogeniibacter mangrovi TaxID=2016596 RepID=A0A6C1B8B7_9RHOO|nr:TRAP transporter small permease subunit [Nitrogeniibacter mangrovi]QID18484.1 TRAP transporter small permease subunit [Nitrogeniibacter mangrovi]
MSVFLKLSAVIDWITEHVGRNLIWLLLGAVLISAGNAISRYGFSLSSNAMLEVQWYLYSAVFILGSGYTLMKNQHVRIDLISNRISAKARNWVDVIGILVFLIPVAVMISAMSWHGFVESYQEMEQSSNAGGLIRWPVRLLIPVGFALLALQAFSELIKRVAFLMGRGPDPLEKPADHGVDIPHEEGGAQ